MLGTGRPFTGSEILAKHLFRAGQITALPQPPPEFILAGGSFAVLVTEDSLADRRRLANRRFRLGATPAVLEHPRQFHQRHGHVFVVVAEQPPSHRQALNQQRFGRRKVAKAALQHAEIVEALCRADVLPECAPAIASACSSSGSAFAFGPCARTSRRSP